MDTPQKADALFSHADAAKNETPTENTEPAVYRSLFSGVDPSGQIA